MRIPSDFPPPLPPRHDAPKPLAEAVGAEAAGWQDAADAVDATADDAASSSADDSESDRPHDHEQDDGRQRPSPQWAGPEEEAESPLPGHEATRRPYLSNGFWVLPEPRAPLPPVRTPSRVPLIAEVPRPCATDLPGHRHARQRRDDRDDEVRRDQDAGYDDGRAGE